MTSGLEIAMKSDAHFKKPDCELKRSDGDIHGQIETPGSVVALGSPCDLRSQIVTTRSHFGLEVRSLS